MHKIRKRRLQTLLFVLMALGVAIGCVAYALRQNINLFYDPTQIFEGEAPMSHTIRIGGLVERGSLQRGKDLNLTFMLTDLRHEIIVHYNGILPDLFREGQGIVAQGMLIDTGHFEAKQVLAKHDETYMPPEIKASLKRSTQVVRDNKIKTI